MVCLIYFTSGGSGFCYIYILWTGLDSSLHVKNRKCYIYTHESSSLDWTILYFLLSFISFHSFFTYFSSNSIRLIEFRAITNEIRPFLFRSMLMIGKQVMCERERKSDRFWESEKEKKVALSVFFVIVWGFILC